MNSGFSVMLRADVRRILLSSSLALTMVLLASIASLLSSAVVEAGVSKAVERLQTGSALTLIEVSAEAEHTTAVLDEATLEKIETLDNVTSVYPWRQVSVLLADESDWPDSQLNPGVISLTPVVPGLTSKVIVGDDDAIETIGDGQIVFPQQVMGGTLDQTVGTTVRLEYTRVVSVGTGEPAYFPLQVTAVADNSVPDKSGPTPAYVSQKTLNTFLELTSPPGTKLEPPVTAYVQVGSVDEVAGVQANLSQMGFDVTALATQTPELSSTLDILALGSTLLTYLAVAVALGVGLSLASSWTKLRRRDIGLLRALGYEKMTIFRLIMGALALVGVSVGLLAVAISCVLSPILTAVVSSQDALNMSVSPWSFPSVGALVLVAILPTVGMLLGAFLPAAKAANMEPDEALRD